MGVWAGEIVVGDQMPGNDPVFHPDHQQAAHVALVDKRAMGHLVVVAVEIDPLGVDVRNLAVGAVDEDIAQAAIGASLGAGEDLIFHRCVEFLEGEALRREVSSLQLEGGQAGEDDTAGRFGPERNGSGLRPADIHRKRDILIGAVFPDDFLAGFYGFERRLEAVGIADEDAPVLHGRCYDGRDGKGRLAARHQEDCQNAFETINGSHFQSGSSVHWTSKDQCRYNLPGLPRPHRWHPRR